MPLLKNWPRQARGAHRGDQSSPKRWQRFQVTRLRRFRTLLETVQEIKAGEEALKTAAAENEQAGDSGALQEKAADQAALEAATGEAAAEAAQQEVAEAAAALG